MDIRKLVKAGKSSYTIALPKQWVEKNNLEKGDRVYLFEKEEGMLITTKTYKDEKKQEHKEKNIYTANKNIDTIKRELTSAYLNNHNIIRISGKDLTNKIEHIRKALQNLVALEITEQTDNIITVKDLLNIKEISVEKTIKRMDMTARSMIKELKEDIGQRDEEVNKMYFLILKLVKKALVDKKTAEQLNINNEQLLTYWYIAINIENLADHVKHLHDLLNKKKEGKVTELVEELALDYEDVMNAYYKKNKLKADEIAQKRQVMLENAQKLPTGFAETATTIINIINNIARTVIDEE